MSTLKTLWAVAPFMKPMNARGHFSRKVTIDAAARLTKDQAIALLELGQGSYCVLRVAFGPRGGWTRAVICHTVSEFRNLKAEPDTPHAYFMVRKIEAGVMQPPRY